MHRPPKTSFIGAYTSLRLSWEILFEFSLNVHMLWTIFCFISNSSFQTLQGWIRQ